ncbi:hypothetical protein SAMN04487898_115130 [Pedobacter sp. ok626]|uniref:hypothetical protein n=1 Tax=Pedobacter sp. ok626 TaxID=1761882 RepID=UPI0008851987|nr:hypothetical protein [Pedobacter sp. ok626]SDL15199.1 hypothetical protein SAMN04487898_115130 [Pedobacter sp. ok626]
MKTYIKLNLAILILFTFLSSCKKDKQDDPTQVSVNNTNWQVTMEVTGISFTDNIFEFGGDGRVFAWHIAAGQTYSGSWTQDGKTVNFIFKEQTAGGDYLWDNTGTLSSDGTTFTGTMQRRGVQGSGTFTAKKL